MDRGYYFGAGPAMLPLPVLQATQQAVAEWQGSGLSILEVSHRTDAFLALLEETRQLLRTALLIPKTYHILLLGGSARLQFAMLPLNVLAGAGSGAYYISGIWSKLAYLEAVRVAQAQVIASSEANQFHQLPTLGSWQPEAATRYLYYTPNETVDGVRVAELPWNYDLPVVADMTSCLLTEPCTVADYALIFAGAQKNLGNAGLTLVLIRDDFLAQMSDKPNLARVLSYTEQVAANSIYATPPIFNILVTNLVLKWVQSQGGAKFFADQHRQQAKLLYDYIDVSDIYQCQVAADCRSILNICFTLPSTVLEQKFLHYAAERGLTGLQGHVKKGGLRASVYNAMPLAGIYSLLEVMDAFAKVAKISRGG